jgi:hypothetical protein
LTRLEERERQMDKAYASFVDEDGVTRGMTGRRCLQPYGVPRPGTQDNFTDPDSRIMVPASGGFEQCYNAQAAVDEGSQLIAMADLINTPSERAVLLSMVDRIECNTDGPRRHWIRFGRRFSGAGESRDSGLRGSGWRGQAARDQGHLPATVRMLERLHSPEGLAHYRRRKTIPEPVFGWIKQIIGFRSFSLRALQPLVLSGG